MTRADDYRLAAEAAREAADCEWPGGSYDRTFRAFADLFDALADAEDGHNPAQRGFNVTDAADAAAAAFISEEA